MGPPPWRLEIRTSGAPPPPGAVTISATPSPVRSRHATNTPPANDGSPTKNPATSVKLPSTLHTRRCGPPPGPGPVMNSLVPSPPTSQPGPVPLTSVVAVAELLPAFGSGVDELTDAV